MKIEPIENRPGWYTLSDGVNQFPVPLSSIHLQLLIMQLERLRPTLDEQARTLLRDEQRKIDNETLREVAETDPPTGLEHLFETDMLESERRHSSRLWIDRHR